MTIAPRRRECASDAATNGTGVGAGDGAPDGSGVGRGKTWPVATRDEAGRVAGSVTRPEITVCVDADARRVVEAEIAALERAADS